MAPIERDLRDFCASDARPAPSPNHGRRLGVDAPDMIILHFTAMESAAAALARLRDPAAEVSAHYLLDVDGTLWGLVPERARAWHAGRAAWAGETDVNSRSIGVELANPGDHAGPRHPFPEPQMRRLEDLLGALRTRWRIPPERVLGHSDVAPRRKRDPGPGFDWARLARRGHAVWPACAGPASDAAPDAAAFSRALAEIGYGDWPEAALLEAFRLRFRPERDVCAPLEPHDVALAEAAARAWPARPRR